MLNIGDRAYYYDTKSNQTEIPCPECLGQCFHEITLGCGDKHTIACERCKEGYLGPSGVTRPYILERVPQVEEGIVTGITHEDGAWKYKFTNKVGNERWFTDRVCATEQEALEKAEDACKKYNAEQMDCATRKYNDTKSWSWNATYHRKGIKDAERNLEHHKRALDWANHKKKDKAA